MLSGMAHPLDGAHLRVLRADRHLAEADGLVNAFAQACEHNIIADYDTQAHRKTLRIHPTPPLPVELPLVVSDAIHNLRAALDYIVYELALHDSGKVQDGTQFIIEDFKVHPTGRNRGFDARSKKYLKGLTQAHINAVEGLQPYNGVDWTETLRDISNPDKHRTLTTLTTDFTSYTLTAHPAGSDYGRRGAVVGGTWWTEGYEFTVDAHDAIAIAPPDWNKPPLMRTLRRLEAEVAGTIELFKPEF